MKEQSKVEKAIEYHISNERIQNDKLSKLMREIFDKETLITEEEFYRVLGASVRNRITGENDTEKNLDEAREFFNYTGSNPQGEYTFEQLSALWEKDGKGITNIEGFASKLALAYEKHQIEKENKKTEDEVEDLMGAAFADTPLIEIWMNEKILKSEDFEHVGNLYADTSDNEARQRKKILTLLMTFAIHEFNAELSLPKIDDASLVQVLSDYGHLKVGENSLVICVFEEYKKQLDNQQLDEKKFKEALNMLPFYVNRQANKLPKDQFIDYASSVYRSEFFDVDNLKKTLLSIMGDSDENNLHRVKIIEALIEKAEVSDNNDEKADIYLFVLHQTAGIRGAGKFAVKIASHMNKLGRDLFSSDLFDKYPWDADSYLRLLRYSALSKDKNEKDNCEEFIATVVYPSVAKSIDVQKAIAKKAITEIKSLSERMPEEDFLVAASNMYFKVFSENSLIQLAKDSKNITNILQRRAVLQALIAKTKSPNNVKMILDDLIKFGLLTRDDILQDKVLVRRLIRVLPIMILDYLIKCENKPADMEEWLAEFVALKEIPLSVHAAILLKAMDSKLIDQEKNSEEIFKLAAESLLEDSRFASKYNAEKSLEAFKILIEVLGVEESLENYNKGNKMLMKPLGQALAKYFYNKLSHEQCLLLQDFLTKEQQKELQKFATPAQKADLAVALVKNKESNLGHLKEFSEAYAHFGNIAGLKDQLAIGGQEIDFPMLVLSDENGWRLIAEIDTDYTISSFGVNAFVVKGLSDLLSNKKTEEELTSSDREKIKTAVKAYFVNQYEAMAAEQILSNPELVKQATAAELSELMKKIDFDKVLEIYKNPNQSGNKVNFLFAISKVFQESKSIEFDDLLKKQDFSGAELIQLIIHASTSDEKTINEIGQSAALSRKVVETFSAESEMSQTSKVKEFVSRLLTSDKVGEIYRNLDKTSGYDDELMRATVDKFTFEEMSGIVKEAPVKIKDALIIAATKSRKEEIENTDKIKDRVTFLLKHIDDSAITSSGLAEIINSYKDFILSDNPELRDIVLPLFEKVFSVQELTSKIINKVEKETLFAYIDHCIAKKPDDLDESNKTALDNIVYAVYNDKNHSELKSEIQKRLSQNWTERYAGMMYKNLKFSDNNEENLHTAREIQTILANPDIVATLGYDEYVRLLNLYKEISIALKTEQYKNAKDENYSKIAEKVGKYQVDSAIKGMVLNLKESAGNGESKNNKALEIANKHLEVLSADLNQKKPTDLIGYAQDFMRDYARDWFIGENGDVGVNDSYLLSFIDIMFPKENIAISDLKLPVALAVEGDKVFDKNQREIGVMGKECVIHRHGAGEYFEGNNGKREIKIEVGVGDALYNEEGKFLGTYNPDNTIRIEILIDADASQKALLNDKNFENLSEKGKNLFFERILESEKLAGFLNSAKSNSNKTKLLEFVVGYLSKNQSSLKAADWEAIVDYLPIDQSLDIFNNCFPVIGLSRPDNAKALLLAMLKNSSKIQELIGNEEGQIKFIEMLQKANFSVEEIEAYFVDKEIANADAKNLLNVFLLRNERYVNNLNSNQLMIKGNTLKLTGLSHKLIQELDSKARVAILKYREENIDKNDYINLSNNLSNNEKDEVVRYVVPNGKLEKLKHIANLDNFGWQMIISVANDGGHYQTKIGMAILNDKDIAEELSGKINVFSNKIINPDLNNSLNSLFRSLLSYKSSALFNKEGKLVSDICGSGKKLLDIMIDSNWNSISFSDSGSLIRYVLDPSNSFYNDVISNMDKISPIINAAAKNKLVDIFYNSDGKLRQDLVKHIPKFIEVAKLKEGSELEKDYKNFMLGKKYIDLSELLGNFEKSNDDDKKAMVKNIFSKPEYIKYMKNVYNQKDNQNNRSVFKEIFDAVKKILPFDSDMIAKAFFETELDSVRNLMNYAKQNFTNEELKESFKTLGGHEKAGVNKKNLNAIVSLSELLDNCGKESSKSQKEISSDARIEANRLLNGGWTWEWFSSFKWLKWSYDYVSDDISAEKEKTISSLSKIGKSIQGGGEKSSTQDVKQNVKPNVSAQQQSNVVKEKQAPIDEKPEENLEQTQRRGFSSNNK